MIRFSKGYGFHYITISTKVSFCRRLTQQTCLTNFSDTHSQHHIGFPFFHKYKFCYSAVQCYGGCAAYFRNTLSSSISHCQIVSRRFCGIKVKLAGGHIFLVVCVYLPFDMMAMPRTLSSLVKCLVNWRLFCTLSIMICWLWLEILMLTLLVLIVLELVNCSIPCRLLV